VIPAVPYVQAIGLEKEELVQALGLSFTVSTLALAFDLASAGALNVGVAGRRSSPWRWPAPACGSDRRCAAPCSWQPSGAGSSSGCLVLGLYLAARSAL
jgi:hypothetical protein